MTQTVEQLQQTEILLNQTLQNLNMPAVFRANLNAFVSSARSITFIMQKEFSSNPRFTEWYKGKQEEMIKDPIFALFKKLRNESLKERPVANRIKFTTEVNATFGANQEATIPFLNVSKDGNIIINNNEPIIINGKPSSITPHTQYSYFFDELPNQDAVELSKLYFNKLKDLVKDCYDNM